MASQHSYSYASFGGVSKEKQKELWELEDKCFCAGRDWALAGNKKLPRIATLPDGTPIPVVKSTSMYAYEFVQGWKSAGKGSIIPQSCPLPQ